LAGTGSAASGAGAASDKKQQLIRKLTEDLQRELDRRLTRLIREKEDVEDVNARLKESQRHVNQSIERAKRDLKRLTDMTTDMEMQRLPALLAWVAELDRGEAAAAAPAEQRDLESFLLPVDGLSEQIVDLEADERACEDAIKCLSDAFEKGLLPLKDFLEHTRDLARQQFVSRAFLLKIRGYSQGQEGMR